MGNSLEWLTGFGLARPTIDAQECSRYLVYEARCLGGFHCTLESPQRRLKCQWRNEAVSDSENKKAEREQASFLLGLPAEGRAQIKGGSSQRKGPD